MITAVVCEWQCSLFQWMAHSTCSSGYCGVDGDYHFYPFNWYHFNEMPLNQSKVDHYGNALRLVTCRILSIGTSLVEIF